VHTQEAIYEQIVIDTKIWRLIRRYDLVLEDAIIGGRSTTQVDTIERLGPDDQYDIALILVRRDQLASVMPRLTANRCISTMILMLNNPAGPNDLVQALGQDRVLLGYPAVGGARDGHIVRYTMIAQQPTMLAELGGRRTARLLAPLLRVQHGRLRFWPPCTYRFKGDA